MTLLSPWISSWIQLSPAGQVSQIFHLHIIRVASTIIATQAVLQGHDAVKAWSRPPGDGIYQIHGDGDVT